jgi:acyl-[acyl-carrier-protein]-phospholipid O-acyltransferase/long-chain-fatty-acid--[acyl-carrier-protein] ligase
MLTLLSIRGFVPLMIVVGAHAVIHVGAFLQLQSLLLLSGLYRGDWSVAASYLIPVMPFLLLLRFAGYCADRWPIYRLLRVNAWISLALFCVLLFSHYAGWITGAFLCLLVLLAQSALYWPILFRYLKEWASQTTLTTAISWLLAWSCGSGLMTALVLWNVLPLPIWSQQVGLSVAASGLQSMRGADVGMLVGSVLMLLMAYRLPISMQISAASDMGCYSDYTYRSVLQNWYRLKKQTVIWQAMIGLSIFWGIVQALLTIWVTMTPDHLKMMSIGLVPCAFICMGIGFIIGSGLVTHGSDDHIESGFIPFGALGITAALWLLFIADTFWTYAIVFVLFGIMSALFTIPLNTMIQFHAPTVLLGRILAARNALLSLGALIGFVLMWGAVQFQYEFHDLLLMIALVGLISAGYTIWTLPQSLIRFLITRFVMIRYRLRVIGFDRLPAQGGVLLLGNYTSWLDWAMVQLACPRPIRFVIEPALYERWYLRYLFRVLGALPSAQMYDDQRCQEITRLLTAGEVVCIFPEGTLSRTGQIGEFYPTFEQVARGASGVIIPFYIRGLWGSRFSYARHRLQHFRAAERTREVIITFGDALAMQTTTAAVRQAVLALSVIAWQQYANHLPTLPEAWLRLAKRQMRSPIVFESQGRILTQRRLMIAVLLVARVIRQQMPAPSIGILLPASTAGVIVNLAAWMAGKTVINLNYTAGHETLAAAVRQAKLEHIVTANQFIQKLQTRGIVIQTQSLPVTWCYLETVFQQSAYHHRLLAALTTWLPTDWLVWKYARARHPSETAAILFSSGSEAQPKGIELTHRNILANARQVADVLNADRDDVMLSNLPLFHAFGLTVTTCFPMLEGLPIVCHPDPRDTLGNAKAIARYRATILCGTSSFLRLYVKNRQVHPLMLDSLRLVIAGAERLDPEVRQNFTLKFNKPIYEGYGATETTPVASVNVPDRLDVKTWTVQIGHKLGTVGLPLPGTSIRIVDPDSLQNLPPGTAGLILIGGVQVMKGYLHDPVRTTQVLIEEQGQSWYRTGDKGYLDADGFLIIVDRYSRFAKIAGEMVSLSAVEQQIRHILLQLDADVQLCVVSIPDARKGEKLVMLLASTQITIDAARASLVAARLSPLTIPSQIMAVTALPLLGSGKTDFTAAKRVAEQQNF